MAKKTKREAAELLGRLAREGIGNPSPMTEEEARRRGQADMDAWIGGQPAEDGKPTACPRCRKRARVRTRSVARTFQSLWGTHTLFRDYYYCEGCREGFYPRDE